MTDIVPAPDIRLSTEFPTGADRTAGVFNSKSKGWADTSRTMAADMDAVGKAARTNATAAQERAQSAGSAMQIATEQADAAMAFRNTAGMHAAASVANAGQAATSAAAAVLDRARAEAAAESAELDAQKVAAALAASEHGPVVTFNGRGGVVALRESDVTDVIPAATTAEMQAGVQAQLRSVSPALLRAAILQISGEGSPVGTVFTGAQKPGVGVWLEGGKTYLQASYPALFAATGLKTDGVITVGATSRGTVTGYYKNATAGGGGVMVITGAPNGGSITHGYRSTDGGLSWSAIAVPSGSWYDGAFGNGRFLLPGVGDSYMTSDNLGVSWTARSFPGGGRSGVAFAAGKWWAFQDVGSTVYSTDGNAWTYIANLPSDVTAGNAVYAVAGAGSVVVIAYANGLLSSPDGGITWRNFALSMSPGALQSTSGRVSYVFANGSSFQSLYTDDGITWEPGRLGAASPANPPLYLSRNSVATNDGLVVVLPGLDGGSSQTYKGVWSRDGITWGVINFAPLAPVSIVSDGSKIATVLNTNSIRTVSNSGYDPATQFYLPAPDRVPTPFKQWIKAS